MTTDIITLRKTKYLNQKWEIFEEYSNLYMYNFQQIQGIVNECKLEINGSDKDTNINY